MRLAVRITIALLAAVTLTATANAAFADSDTWQFHRYRRSIEALAERGIMSGFPDGSFGAEEILNRAQALKIVTLLAGIPVDPAAGSCFLDVIDEWFAPYVCTAKERGWIVGEGKFFHPERDVSFGEAFKMLVVSQGYDVHPSEPGRPWFTPFIAEMFNRHIIDEPAFKGNWDELGALPVPRKRMAEFAYHVLLERKDVAIRFDARDCNLDAVTHAFYEWEPLGANGGGVVGESPRWLFLGGDDGGDPCIIGEDLDPMVGISGFNINLSLLPLLPNRSELRPDDPKDVASPIVGGKAYFRASEGYSFWGRHLWEIDVERGLIRQVANIDLLQSATLSPDYRYLVYVEDAGANLTAMDLQTRRTVRVAQADVGESFAARTDRSAYNGPVADLFIDDENILTYRSYEGTEPLDSRTADIQLLFARP